MIYQTYQKAYILRIPPNKYKGKSQFILINRQRRSSIRQKRKKKAQTYAPLKNFPMGLFMQMNKVISNLQDSLVRLKGHVQKLVSEAK